MTAFLHRVWICSAALLAATPAAAAPASQVDRLVAQRDALIEQFRRSDASTFSSVAPYILTLRQGMGPVVTQFEQLASTRTGKQRLDVQIELAKALALVNRKDDAARLFESIAPQFARLGDRERAFKSWIGAARNHQDMRRFEAAAEAYRHAAEVAGSSPTPRQRQDLASYAAEFQEGRGELEAALVSGFEADQTALNAEDRYYAALELASTFGSLAKTCDERRLVDARSLEAGDDGWGACRRAVAAAKRWDLRAKEAARASGWRLLAQMQTDLSLSPGALAWENNLKLDQKFAASAIARPRSAKDVLVSEHFWTSAAGAGGGAEAQIGQLLDSIQATADTIAFATSPTILISQANSAELQGDSARALAFERQAANLLLRDRSGYFDPLRRGAMVERNASLPRNLALRLLQRGARADAFDLLESFRGRGIGEMTAVLAQPDLASADRAWLAALTRLEAELSAAQNRLIERSLAKEGERPAAADIDEFANTRRSRQKLLADGAHRQRFEKSAFEQVRLDELKAVVARERVPVLLYWTAPAQLIAWLITPEPVAIPSVGKPDGLGPRDQVNVRSIFLTEPVLSDNVRRVRNSASSEGVPFDEEAARRLYLFLIAPFEKALGTGPVMIVPQGALAELPFETLIDSDGRYFAERHVTSYAPSATLARAALGRPSKIPLKIAAIQDETIASEEIDRIRAVAGPGLTVTPAFETGLSQLIKLAADSPVLHVLAHGEFDYHDPLLSPLKLGSPVVAADLLAVPLGKTRLVVLSACEVGTQGRRVSNELFGFPWALQVAGAHNAIVSRWAVPSEANAAWMPDFYAALGKGQSPASAAAAASRAMIARGERQPHDWAAMQVIGR